MNKFIENIKHTNEGPEYTHIPIFGIITIFLKNLQNLKWELEIN